MEAYRALSGRAGLRVCIQRHSNKHELLKIWAVGRRQVAAAASLRTAFRAGVGLGDQDLLANLGAAALHVGDDAAATACFTAMISEGRDTGAGIRGGKLDFPAVRIPPLRELSPLIARACSGLTGSVDVPWEAQRPRRRGTKLGGNTQAGGAGASRSCVSWR